MKKHLKSFGINLFISSPVLAALLLIYGLVYLNDQTHTCTVIAPSEVPRCMPDEMTADDVVSIQQSENGYYLACEDHEHNQVTPSVKAPTKYVVAAMELQ